MKDWRSQAHVKWDCKYHIVICPKYRRRKFYGRLRGQVGEILRDLCRQKEIELLERHARPNHVHMLLSIPPKYSIAMTLGYLQGKSAIRIHRELQQTKGTLFGRTFWSRGSCVSTVGLDEAMIKRYIQQQQFPLASSRSALFRNRLLRDEFLLWVANHHGRKRQLGEVGASETSCADRQSASATVSGRSERRNSV